MAKGARKMQMKHFRFVVNFAAVGKSKKSVKMRGMGMEKEIKSR